jgi:hypothetical protein
METETIKEGYYLLTKAQWKEVYGNRSWDRDSLDFNQGSFCYTVTDSRNKKEFKIATCPSCCENYDFCHK